MSAHWLHVFCTLNLQIAQAKPPCVPLTCQDRHFTEIFAGCQAVTFSLRKVRPSDFGRVPSCFKGLVVKHGSALFWEAGFKGTALDIDIDKSFDILSPAGFLPKPHRRMEIPSALFWTHDYPVAKVLPQ